MQQAYFRTIPWILVFWKSAFLAGATMQQADFRTIPWILDLEKSAFFLVQQCNRHFHILILDEDKKALYKLPNATAQQAVFHAWCQKWVEKALFGLVQQCNRHIFARYPEFCFFEKALFWLVQQCNRQILHDTLNFGCILFLKSWKVSMVLENSF